MIHVRTKEFLLVVVVVVVVETLCLRRFVYRHKGVNHRQAAVESVKEGERGKKEGERKRERESLALILEKKCKMPSLGPEQVVNRESSLLPCLSLTLVVFPSFRAE